MRGVTEERLKYLLDHFTVTNFPYSNEQIFHYRGLLTELIKDECTELNPWKPIETAPKDRRILLFDSKANLPFVGFWFFGNGSGNWNYLIPEYDSCPTHWQELPEPPK